jgi:hypothetical protein
MNAVLRRRFDMADRVRAFFRTHPMDGAAERAAVERLDVLMARVEKREVTQQQGMGTALSATQQRARLRRELQTRLLRYLAAVAAVAAPEDAGFGEVFRVPRTRLTNQDFIALVKLVLAKATEAKERLVSGGMSETLPGDIARALADFEQTLVRSKESRLEHVGASADLQAVGHELSRHMRVLDGLVRYRFGDRADLMGEWLSARNVYTPSRRNGADEDGAASG